MLFFFFFQSKMNKFEWIFEKWSRFKKFFRKFHNVWIQLKEIKTAWKMKTPYQKWRSFYWFCEFVGDVLQIGTFGNLKIGIIGYFPCVTGFLHYTLLIYTVYYYINCGHFVGCLPSFCIFGLVTSVNEHTQHT